MLNHDCRFRLPQWLTIDFKPHKIAFYGVKNGQM